MPKIGDNKPGTPSFTWDRCKVCDKLAWVDSCLFRLQDMLPAGTTILAPKIGCGLGGLKWKDVSKLLKISDMNWIIYTKEGVLDDW